MLPDKRQGTVPMRFNLFFQYLDQFFSLADYDVRRVLGGR
jgi:hypothetical protein